VIGQPGLDRAPPSPKSKKAQLVQIGGMTVGTVPVTSLVQRRKNFQAMAPEDFAALEASLAKHGMRSFVVVVPGATTNTWEVIDGHHRWQAAERAGITDIPVVVLDKGAEGVDADVAMLAFNVRAAPVAETYASFLRELSQRMDVADLALRTGMTENFLSQLRTDLPAMSGFTDEGSSTDEGDDAAAPDRSRGTPVMMAFPRTDTVLALIARVQELTGTETPVDAVIALMNRAVAAAAAQETR
jgi:hypothetical protein